jgi:tetratricopeptide (TPR) repeat protein
VAICLVQRAVPLRRLGLDFMAILHDMLLIKLRDQVSRRHILRPRHCCVVLATFLTLLVDQAAAQAGRPEVDYDRENDYYAAISTGRHKAVEQYHLGPCEQNLSARNFRKAIAECDFILKIFPNHPRALLLTVKTCEQWKSPECRLDEAFERAIAINPKASATFVLNGIYLHGAKQYSKARQSYERALELDADSINAHYNLGLACVELKDYACANEHAQRAYALGSTLPGLRDKLQKAGQWKPVAPKQSSLPEVPPNPSRLAAAD